MTSDRWTEEQLEELEERIKSEYKTAYREVKQKASAYFATLQDRIDKEEEAWKAGKYTDDQFKAWKQAQIARGQRWEAVRDDLANRITTANQAAAAYINDTTPGIYALNHNYESYLIDQAKPISWTLYDENTIKRLMYDENHSEFRTVSINPVRDYNWNREQIQTAITSGILQGKSMKQMADAFIGVMGRNQTAAMRNARTAVTSAQNGGRQDCYEKAQSAGIKIKKEWIATLDDRTRASHGDLDGERVEVDKPFSNGLMYPGDPDGAPAEVYNCRCTTRAVLPGITDGKTRQTYDEWMEERKDSELTGGKIIPKNETKFERYVRREEEAKNFYEKVRNTNDVKLIAKNLNEPKEKVELVKKHVFFNKHKMDDGKIERFPADYDMAVAWKRMQEGKQNDTDILLFNHEYLELSYEKKYNCRVRTAHDKANKTYNWQRAIDEKLGEKGEADGLL